MADTIIQFRSEIDDHKKIFCITFTNNAVKCISTKLQEHYGCIPDNIVVSTIHSFLYQEFVRPYYYLLFGKQYKRISGAELPGKLHTETLRLLDWKTKMCCIKLLFQKELSGL